MRMSSKVFGLVLHKSRVFNISFGCFFQFVYVNFRSITVGVLLWVAACQWAKQLTVLAAQKYDERQPEGEGDWKDIFDGLLW
jgi:hypothetical protein